MAAVTHRDAFPRSAEHATPHISVIPLIQPHCQSQHHSRHADAHHDAGQYQSGRQRIDVGSRIRDAVRINRGASQPADITVGSQEQVDSGIHHRKADNLLDQVFVQQKHRETDAEKDQGRHFVQMLVHEFSDMAQHQKAPLLNMV